MEILYVLLVVLSISINSIQYNSQIPFKTYFSQVARRNARERNRVSGVNGGFGVLKATVPNLKNKSSKVETLKAAIEYIKAMRSVLGLEDIQDSGRMGEEMDFGDDDGEFVGTNTVLDISKLKLLAHVC